MTFDNAAKDGYKPVNAEWQNRNNLNITDMESANYFAVLNYTCEYNNGIPVYVIAETKEEILRKMNNFTESLFSQSFYTMDDLSEEGRLYMGCVMDEYIGDDFTFCTDKRGIFDELINNIYFHNGVKPILYDC